MKIIFRLLLTLTSLLFIRAIPGNKIATFWGSNAVSLAHGLELSLRDYCESGVYDTIILTTLTSNSKDSNEDDLPSLDFANHCIENPLPKKYNRYLKCPQIEEDIKYCQKEGIRILLDIGRSNEIFGFQTQLEAKHFAWKIWNLFLGGGAKTEIRTFGSAVLDGINLSLRNGRQELTIDFVSELHRIMIEKGNSKHYILTASPNCLITNNDTLTPTFDRMISAFDSIFVNFAGSICTLNNIPSFNATLQNWLVYSRKPNGPHIYIGVAASDRSPTSDFVLPNVLENVYQSFSHRYHNEIKGILLDDAGWDGLKMYDGLPYSSKVHTIVKGYRISRPVHQYDSEPVTATTSTAFGGQQQRSQPRQQKFVNVGGKSYVVVGQTSTACRGQPSFCYLLFFTLSLIFLFSSERNLIILL